MNDTAKLTYRISDEEWLRTSEMRSNPEIFPTFHCFHGHVSFRVGGREVLVTDEFDICVADLAVGLANVAGNLRTGAIGTFKFQQGDDMLEISFDADRDFVSITHNLSPNNTWGCNRAILEGAIVKFVASFTDEAAMKIQDLFTWQDLGILRYFLSASNSR